MLYKRKSTSPKVAKAGIEVILQFDIRVSYLIELIKARPMLCSCKELYMLPRVLLALHEWR